MTFYSVFYTIDKNEIEREKNAFGRIKKRAEGLYVLYKDVFSKEAEMKMSRKLGTDMTLLFFLRFLINKTRGIKAFGRFRIFILNWSFLSFLGEIIFALVTIGVCGYLYRSCLLRRFLALGYCSIPINGLGGEFNDFNK